MQLPSKGIKPKCRDMLALCYFCLLFGSPTTNLGSLSRGWPHSLDMLITGFSQILTRWSLRTWLWSYRTFWNKSGSLLHLKLTRSPAVDFVQKHFERVLSFRARNFENLSNQIKLFSKKYHTLDVNIFLYLY